MNDVIVILAALLYSVGGIWLARKIGKKLVALSDRMAPK